MTEDERLVVPESAVQQEERWGLTLKAKLDLIDPKEKITPG